MNRVNDGSMVRECPGKDDIPKLSFTPDKKQLYEEKRPFYYLPLSYHFRTAGNTDLKNICILKLISSWLC
jgi:hypothetical protein